MMKDKIKNKKDNKKNPSETGLTPKLRDHGHKIGMIS